MTTFYSIVIAAAVFVTCMPAAIYFGDKAGIPDYGTNPDQKPGWTVLYCLCLFPACAAFAWLVALALVTLISD